MSLTDFLPFLWGHNVLVRTNTTTVAHLTSKGSALLCVAHSGTQTVPLELCAWPRELLYAFPPPPFPHSRRNQPQADTDSSTLASAETCRMLCAQPCQLPARRDFHSQQEGTVFHLNSQQMELWAWLGWTSAGLLQSVVNTIQNATAPSTRSLHDSKWTQ